MINWVKQKIYNTGLNIAYDRFKTNRLRTEISSSGKQSALEFDWSQYKTSDTLYVLGSGLSVMDYSSANWDEVKKHDSFGFNGWIFHDFIPTFYGIEPMANDLVFGWYIKALQEKSVFYRNVPIFVQYQHLKMRNKHFDYPDICQENLFYNAPYMPNTLCHDVLKNYIKNWASLEHEDFSKVFHYAGSLSYVITMAFIMGYKKIVLLGVDLNSSEYFYSNENAGELAKQFNNFQLNRPKIEKWNLKATHNTMSKKVSGKYGCLPISFFIDEFNKLSKEHGVELLIGSKGSALYPMLDLYTFPK